VIRTKTIRTIEIIKMTIRTIEIIKIKTMSIKTPRAPAPASPSRPSIMRKVRLAARRAAKGVIDHLAGRQPAGCCVIEDRLAGRQAAVTNVGLATGVISAGMNGPVASISTFTSTSISTNTSINTSIGTLPTSRVGMNAGEEGAIKNQAPLA
jgi:hypothetical protein